MSPAAVATRAVLDTFAQILISQPSVKSVQKEHSLRTVLIAPHVLPAFNLAMGSHRVSRAQRGCTHQAGVRCVHPAGLVFSRGTSRIYTALYQEIVLTSMV